MRSTGRSKLICLLTGGVFSQERTMLKFIVLVVVKVDMFLTAVRVCLLALALSLSLSLS